MASAKRLGVLVPAQMNRQGRCNERIEDCSEASSNVEQDNECETSDPSTGSGTKRHPVGLRSSNRRYARTAGRSPTRSPDRRKRSLAFQTFGADRESEPDRPCGGGGSSDSAARAGERNRKRQRRRSDRVRADGFTRASSERSGRLQWQLCFGMHSVSVTQPVADLHHTRCIVRLSSGIRCETGRQSVGHRLHARTISRLGSALDRPAWRSVGSFDANGLRLRVAIPQTLPVCVTWPPTTTPSRRTDRRRSRIVFSAASRRAFGVVISFAASPSARRRPALHPSADA